MKIRTKTHKDRWFWRTFFITDPKGHRLRSEVAQAVWAQGPPVKKKTGRQAPLGRWKTIWRVNKRHFFQFFLVFTCFYLLFLLFFTFFSVFLLFLLGWFDRFSLVICPSWWVTSGKLDDTSRNLQKAIYKSRGGSTLIQTASPNAGNVGPVAQQWRTPDPDPWQA